MIVNYGVVLDPRSSTLCIFLRDDRDLVSSVKVRTSPLLRPIDFFTDLRVALSILCINSGEELPLDAVNAEVRKLNIRF